uniref:Aldose 1-epimerase n=1 Tax=Kalanchoe fedtschenkoi TaxID=63787 RepID=A0A7N0V0I8_KALFE
MAKLVIGCCLLLLASAAVSVTFVSADDGIKLYELKRGDITLKLTNWGATIVSLILPDKNGKLDDIVLGYDSLDTYKNDTTYFGAIVGRVANRIGGAHFTLDGVTYKLPANDGNNTLHGGPKGYADVVWHVESYKENSHITFTYKSFDGEEGFPGALDVKVTYMFVRNNGIGIKMEARPLDKPTPVNLALHAYWNIRGHNSGTILDHQIQIFANSITPVDGGLIPTGQITPVQNTAFDFLEPQEIGSRISQVAGGYDINYVLIDAGKGKHLSPAAVVSDKVSGRRMELWTNKPGVQFYTSNMFSNVAGKDGAVYPTHAALCLETQGFPDSVNHPNFPSQIVKPGETYEHIMAFRFTSH